MNRAPGWVAPHQPRLDWQMWFAALGTYQPESMVSAVCVLQLLKNEPDVTELLERNPFPNDSTALPPGGALRLSLHHQRGTRTTGAWWKREERGIYLPRVSVQ